MGFFKKLLGSESPAPAPGPDFDALREAAGKNAPGAMNALWQATYGLEKWFFVGSGSLPSEVRPFCGELNDAPHVFAFTDAARANVFGQAQGLRVQTNAGSGAVGVLEVARDEAIGLVLSLQNQGVVGIAFNVGSGAGAGGYFAPLGNVAPMFAHCTGRPLADVAATLGLDPGALLHDRFSQTGQDAHLSELLQWVYRAKTWSLLADHNDPSTPRIWKDPEGAPTLAIFTGPERLEFGARMLKHAKADGSVPVLEMPVKDSVAMIATLAAEGRLATVALNLRIPLKAESMPMLHERFGG